METKKPTKGKCDLGELNTLASLPYDSRGSKQNARPRFPQSL
jgi:hypothetical protein